MKTGLGVKIITGDRDLLQLVDERVIVTLPGKSLSDSKDYMVQDVVETLGVRPDQIVDYKALVGDKSDNIPGVVGVGKVTAEKLLGTYGDLDNIYEHLDELKPNVRKKLEASRADAYLSQELARIVVDLDIPLDLDQARPEAFDPDEIEGIFRELEFRALNARLTRLVQSYGLSGSSREQQLSMFPGEANSPSSSPGVQITGDYSLNTVIIDTPAALAEPGR